MKIAQTQPNAVWLDSFGLGATQDAEDGEPGYDRRLFGTAAGYDRLLGKGFLLGLGGGIAQVDIDIEDSASRADMEGGFGSVYGSLFSKKAYLDAAFSYGITRFRNLRAVVVGDSTLVAESEHEGSSLSAYLESGYNFTGGGWLLEPFLGVRYGHLSEDAYEESGLAGAGLSVAAQTTDSLLAKLGIRVAKPFKLGAWTVLPEGSAAWAHDFPLSDGQITAAFASAPTLSFSTESAETGKDRIAAGFGLTLMRRNDMSVSASYSGEFWKGYAEHSFVGGFRFEF